MAKTPTTSTISRANDEQILQSLETVLTILGGYKKNLRPHIDRANAVLADLQARVSTLEAGQGQGKKRLTGKELVVGEREDKCLQSYATWLAFWRAHANLSVSLGMEGPKHNAQLLFYDQAKKKRLSLGLDNDGAPSLVMFDAKEREVWSMPPEAAHKPKGKGKKKPA